MLATTIQITNNPPHTPRHPNHKRSRPGMQATTTTTTQRHQLAVQATTTLTGGGRSHGVEREPDSVLACITLYAQPKNAPTPTTHIRQ